MEGPFFRSPCSEKLDVFVPAIYSTWQVFQSLNFIPGLIKTIPQARCTTYKNEFAQGLYSRRSRLHVMPAFAEVLLQFIHQTHAKLLFNFNQVLFFGC